MAQSENISPEIRPLSPDNGPILERIFVELGHFVLFLTQLRAPRKG